MNRAEFVKYRGAIRVIVLGHIVNRLCTINDFLPESEYHFYLERILSIPNYGLTQAREILKMVCRCAFNDSTLTDNEAIVIMETCLDPALDNILLEVNYNEGW